MTDDRTDDNVPNWVTRQTERVLETGTTEGVQVLERPVVLLTLKGAKTGQTRRTLLMRVEHGGTYAVVASKGGAPENPDWYYNIKAYPRIALQDGTETKTFVAREVTGDERVVWWQRAVEAFPRYAEYQAKVDRDIPVLLLEPA